MHKSLFFYSLLSFCLILPSCKLFLPDEDTTTKPTGERGHFSLGNTVTKSTTKMDRFPVSPSTPPHSLRPAAVPSTAQLPQTTLPAKLQHIPHVIPTHNHPRQQNLPPARQSIPNQQKILQSQVPQQDEWHVILPTKDLIQRISNKVPFSIGNLPQNSKISELCLYTKGRLNDSSTLYLAFQACPNQVSQLPIHSSHSENTVSTQTSQGGIVLIQPFKSYQIMSSVSSSHSHSAHLVIRDVRDRDKYNKNFFSLGMIRHRGPHSVPGHYYDLTNFCDYQSGFFSECSEASHE